MSNVQTFAEERRSDPWPTHSDAPVTATDLYGAYQSWCADRGETPLPRDGRSSFGAALTAFPWIARQRVAGGYVYTGIAILARADRAREEVIGNAFGGLVAEEVKRLYQEHADRLHDGRTYNCRCDTSGLFGKARAAAEARPDIDQWVDDWYGPYLRWEDGDPEPHDPRCPIPAAEHDRIAAQMAAFRAQYGNATDYADPDDADQRVVVRDQGDQSDLW